MKKIKKIIPLIMLALITTSCVVDPFSPPNYELGEFYLVKNDADLKLVSNLENVFLQKEIINLEITNELTPTPEDINCINADFSSRINYEYHFLSEDNKISSEDEYSVFTFKEQSVPKYEKSPRETTFKINDEVVNPSKRHAFLNATPTRDNDYIENANFTKDTTIYKYLLKVAAPATSFNMYYDDNQTIDIISARSYSKYDNNAISEKFYYFYNVNESIFIYSIDKELDLEKVSFEFYQEYKQVNLNYYFDLEYRTTMLEEAELYRKEEISSVDYYNAVVYKISMNLNTYANSIFDVYDGEFYTSYIFDYKFSENRLFKINISTHLYPKNIYWSKIPPRYQYEIYYLNTYNASFKHGNEYQRSLNLKTNQYAYLNGEEYAPGVDISYNQELGQDTNYYFDSVDISSVKTNDIDTNSNIGSSIFIILTIIGGLIVFGPLLFVIIVVTIVLIKKHIDKKKALKNLDY